MKKPRKPGKEPETPHQKGLRRRHPTLDDIERATERVKKAVAEAELDRFGVTKVTFRVGDGEEIPIGEWTGAEAERQHTRGKKPRGK
jgi:hypothetical protein